MRRRVITILAAVALLLCVSVLVLWVRSYWYMSNVGYAYWSGPPADHLDRRRTQQYSLTLASGKVIWTSNLHYAPPRKRAFFWNLNHRLRGHYDWNNPKARWHAGFVYRNDDVVAGLGQSRLWLFAVPMYVVFVVAALNGFALLHLNKRYRPGLCPSCGYDLRATPERCPECGHVPTSGATKEQA